MNKRYPWIGAAAAAAILGAFLIFSGVISGHGDEIIPRTGHSASANDGTVPTYDYTAAPDHIGERAVVSGTVHRVATVKSGVTFLDFCPGFGDCPFSAVIFAGDLAKFSDVSQYERPVRVTGVIKSYQGRAEMILNSPDQIE